MILVLEKCSGDDNQVIRSDNRIKIAKVLAKQQEIPGVGIREKLRFITHHIQNHMSNDQWKDQFVEIYYSGVKQGELTEKSWDVKHDLDTDALLDTIKAKGEILGNFLHVGCGVLTNRDNITASNINRLSHLEIEKYGIKVSDGIFVLSEEEYHNLSLSSKENVIIKPWYKNSDIACYVPEPHEPKRYLIYLKNKDNLNDFPKIKAHLLKFKGILDYQSLEYGEGNSWYAVTRASEDSVLKCEKLFTPYRAEINTFAYSDVEFFSSKDVYYITYKTEPRDIKESLYYVLGLLNSKVIEFWCHHKIKPKGKMREFYATPLKEIPIRRIDFNNSEDVSLYNSIEQNVKAIRETRTELASYSGYFEGVKLNHLRFQDTLPNLNFKAVVHRLQPENIFSLRTHPKIKITFGINFQESSFILNKILGVSLKLEGAELTLYGDNKEAIFLEGEEKLLRIVAVILGEYENELWSNIKEKPFIPKNAEIVEVQMHDILSEVSKLRTQIQDLQLSIDGIASTLYGIPKDQISL